MMIIIFLTVLGLAGDDIGDDNDDNNDDDNDDDNDDKVRL